MSGRASRARLLAPSFLVVASALACGGKAAETSGGPDEGIAGSIGNPQFNPPPPVCPAAQPERGSACFGGLACSYPSRLSSCGMPSLPTQANCENGVWVVNESIYTCNPPIPLMCPPTLPSEGTPCPGFALPNSQCFYNNSACGIESASCNGSAWRVNRCEVMDGEGGAGPVPPDIGGAPSDSAGAAGAAGEAGSPQGGASGS